VSVDFFAYAFGAAAVLWVVGFGAGLVFGFLRRVRDVV